MKKSILIITICLFQTLGIYSQVSREKFASEIDSLIQLSLDEFNEIRSSESYKVDGQTIYQSTYLLDGAKKAEIAIDEENIGTYSTEVALSTSTLATAELEYIANTIATVSEKYGLVRSDGTDVKYEKFKAIRVELDSEDIDVLGKHPAFTIGILRNSSTVEIILNEPLWK